MPKQSPNLAAERTLDKVARSARPVVPSDKDSAREPLWDRGHWRFHLALAIVTGLAIFAAYANSFGPGADRAGGVNWTLDNKYIIQLDPRTKAPQWEDSNGKVGIKNIWIRDYWWPKGISGLYRPIVSFTYWINWYKMSGDESQLDADLSPEQRFQKSDQIERSRLRVFHAVNYFSHWLSSVLVYFVALLLTRRLWTSAAIGLLFGLHPVAVESVTNIIGRADIFASITVMGGLLLYVRATRSRGLWKAPWLLALGLLAMFGVFSKESAIAVVAVIALYDAIYRVPWRQLFNFTTKIQIDLLLLAIRIALVVLLCFFWWKATLEGLVPVLDSWMPVAGPGQPISNVPANYILIIALAVIAFISLVAALAMLPWGGKFRFWWMPPMAVPLVYIIIVAFAGVQPKFAIGFLIVFAVLAATEFVLQKSSDDLEPLALGEGSPGNPWRWLADHYLVFIPVLIGLFAVRSAIFGATTPPETPFLDNPIRGVNWYAGRITALQVMVRLWGILIWPYKLCCDYSFNQVPTFGRWSTTANDVLGLASTVLVIGVVIFAIYLWKRSKPASFFILFFFIAFLPTSNIIVTIGSIMAERFMYLPLIGFIGCLVLAVEWTVGRVQRAMTQTDQNNALASTAWKFNPVVIAIIVLIATMYGTRTFMRNFDWRSDLTLWETGKNVSPNSFRSYQSYAFALFEELNLPEERRQPETKKVTIDQCIDVVEQGRPIVDLLPDRLNSSRLYMHQGMYLAIKAERTLRENPEDQASQASARGFFIRAINAFERGRQVDRAFNETNRQKEFERGKRDDEILDTGLPQIYDYLGKTYARLSAYDHALENFAYLRHLDPYDLDHWEQVASTYIAMGKHDEACASLIATLYLDANRKYLWKVLQQESSSLSPPSQPVIIVSGDGSLRLDRANAVSQSLLCSAYLQMTRVFLEAKQWETAARIRRAAVREAGFSASLFDDMYKQANRVPPEIPAVAEPAPQPPAQQQSPLPTLQLPRSQQPPMDPSKSLQGVPPSK